MNRKNKDQNLLFFVLFTKCDFQASKNYFMAFLLLFYLLQASKNCFIAFLLLLYLPQAIVSAVDA